MKRIQSQLGKLSSENKSQGQSKKVLPKSTLIRRRTISRCSRGSDQQKGEGVVNARFSPKPRDSRRTASIHQMEGVQSGAPEKISIAPSYSLQKMSSKADKKLVRSNSVTICKQVVRSSSPSKKANFVQINLRMFNNYF